MIKTQKLAPSNYYKESRDFQLFGRIYDVIFNYLKNNTLAVNDITTNLNPNQKILDLMCNTLGFKTRHEYNNDELSALCSIFLSCMRSKGSIKSIKLLLEMVASIENSTSEPVIMYDYEGIDLTIMIPSDIKDWTLIRDVMDYIMPAGSSYSLISQSVEGTDATTYFTIDDILKQKYSWSPVNAMLIKIDNNQNIVNKAIELNEDMTGKEIVSPNTNMESMNSEILRVPDNVTEEDYKEINEWITKATK